MYWFIITRTCYDYLFFLTLSPLVINNCSVARGEQDLSNVLDSRSSQGESESVDNKWISLLY